MPITNVQITAVPKRPVDQIEFVEDLEVLVESEKCSCNSGDDNPY